MPWNRNIHTVKESSIEDKYENVDGTYDVYVESDSKKGHSHDHVDKNGNLLENYHDTLMSFFSDLTTDETLSTMTYNTNEDCIKVVQKN